MKATLKNIFTGEIIEVVATTDHSTSSYGQPVWVDQHNHSYGQVGLPMLGYKIEIIEEQEEPS